jgi:ubiquinone/menaquinone biosynthesis C-methylase UbiE
MTKMLHYSAPMEYNPTCGKRIRAFGRRMPDMCGVCPSWLSFILYNPVRKALTDREKVLDESGITPDSVVLEVGPGNGFFTEAIAGRAGRVLSIELQEGMARKLRGRTASFGDKVKIEVGDVASIVMPDGAFDVCLLYYSFHEIAGQEAAAVNIARSLKPGGIISIYEPSFEVRKADMRKTIGFFERLGFHREEERNGIFTRFARLRKS